MKRGSLIPAADAATAIATLRTELTTLFFIAEITPALLQSAEALAEKHAIRRKF